MDIKTSDLLRSAHDRIMEPSAWCQGIWEKVPNLELPGLWADAGPGGSGLLGDAAALYGTPVTWCSEGSLMRAVITQVLGMAEDRKVTHDEMVPLIYENPAYMKAMDYLRQAIAVDNGYTREDGSSGMFSVPTFNDSHDHSQVMQVWEQAIKFADEDGN